jgi:hypothetical protein
VEVEGGHTIPHDKYIPHMSLTLGRYNLTQDFYVMDLPDTNVILGVQWLITWTYHHQLQIYGDVLQLWIRKEGDIEEDDRECSQSGFSKAHGGYI